jgi:hypothetical protein
MEMDAMKRAVLTVATGKPAYWAMAVELARSFEYWNRDNDIGFFVLTDLDEPVPPALRRLRKIAVPRGSLGNGFSAKLHLDRFAPAEQTLFIDADCLCVKPLDFVFDRFAGRAVSVVGGTIAQGEWFGDVTRTCREAQVAALPKFNGGIYYLEPGAKASAVYERARALLPHYDALGLVRLRGSANDELLMAIAMAQENCWGIQEDGSVMGEFLSTPKVIALDTVRGRCILDNPPPPDPRHRAWFALPRVRPAVVHFLGNHVSDWLYRSEVLRLRLVVDYRVPPVMASAAGSVFRWPHQITDAAKDALRPALHATFGPRKVREGIR